MSERIVHAVRTRWIATGTSNAGAQVLLRVAICFAAMAVHYSLVPTLYSWKPGLSLALFAAVIVARQRGCSPAPSPPPLSARASLIFVCLHAILIVFLLRYSSTIAWAAQTPGLRASLVAFSKLFVLLPTMALFPVNYLRRVSAEAAAGGLALLTFSPDRFFELIWPAYSHVVAAAIVLLCRFWIPTTHVTQGIDGLVVVGPTVDMTLGVSCSGIRSINLFQILFAIIIIVEWHSINKVRSMIFYAVTCCALMAVNSVRLAIVYLTANLTSNYVNLSWPLFVLTFLVLIWVTYDWMVPPRQTIMLDNS